jgi:hypothetical protein
MVRSTSRRHRLVAAFALLAPVVLTACEPSTTAVPDTGQNATERVVAGSLHSRSGAYLTVGDAASRVDVRLAALPGLLYRISTPAGSGLAPRVTGADGRVRLRLRATGDDGPDTVTILLNRAVRWDIRLPAGAGEQWLDLSAGSVARLDLGSAGLLTVDLPRPFGTVPVTLRGAAGSVSVSAPPRAPVRLRLLGGAGSVRTPWVRTDGVPAGAVLADPRWRGTGDRYMFSALGGVSTVTVR